ncbi:MAG: hypothetical protein ACRD1S_07505 [Vicinamibacterales bacterium]
MGPIDAWRAGLGRVWRAPALLAGGWLATVVAAAPAAWAVRSAIRAHLGSSLSAVQAAETVNYDWWQEFTSQASGAAATFVLSIMGFAAPLGNLSDFADAAPIPAGVAAAVLSFLLVQVFLTGGIIDRYARDTRLGSFGFIAACGASFFRLLRLGTLALAVYWLLFAYLRPASTALYELLTRDVTVERRAFAIYAALTVVFLLLVAAVNLVFDFAKIRLVTEDRRSAIGALASGLRFIARQPGAAVGLYLLNVLVFAAVLGLYAIAAPSAAASGWALVGALLVMQLFILARVWARLLFVASETALFQSRLAHARYVARPVSARPAPAALGASLPSADPFD